MARRKRRLRTSLCLCRGRLGTLKTPSCPWRGCPAAGQNLEAGHLSRHYVAEISLNVTLNHNHQQSTTTTLTLFQSYRDMDVGDYTQFLIEPKTWHYPVSFALWSGFLHQSTARCAARYVQHECMQLQVIVYIPFCRRHWSFASKRFLWAYLHVFIWSLTWTINRVYPHFIDDNEHRTFWSGSCFKNSFQILSIVILSVGLEINSLTSGYVYQIWR